MQNYGAVVGTAFDSIAPSAMNCGLRSFGLPEHVLDVIRSIYTDRCFEVRDCGATSSSRPQASGISQGCPLSPFLFVMTMTVIIEQAASQLTGSDRDSWERGSLSVLLYADDTLILGRTTRAVEALLQAVQHAGRSYGMELHPDKFQLLKVRCAGKVRNVHGDVIPAQPDMIYLGALISDTGDANKELSRRLGAARADFDKLSKIWRHSSLSRHRKVEIYKAVILSKLTYGLSSLWFSAAGRRRLDGFHCRCLRSIWGIAPAFISRVSNATVLRETGQAPLTDAVARQQLLLLGKAARAPEGSLLREVAFCPKSFRPASERYVKKVGRPRADWTTQVLRMASVAANGLANVIPLLTNEASWRHFVRTADLQM